MSYAAFTRTVAQYGANPEKLRDGDALLAQLWALIDLIAQSFPLNGVGVPALLAGLRTLATAMERVSRMEFRAREAAAIMTRSDVDRYLDAVLRALREFVPEAEVERAIQTFGWYVDGLDLEQVKLGPELVRPIAGVDEPSTAANETAYGNDGEAYRGCFDTRGTSPTTGTVPPIDATVEAEPRENRRATCGDCRAFAATTLRCSRKNFFVAPSSGACPLFEATSQQDALLAVSSTSGA